MKSLVILLRLAGTLAFPMLAGCGHKEHGHHETGHSHGDDAQSFSGATHKEEGITLLDRTRKILGVQVQEAEETNVTKQLCFTVRVFAQETNGRALASGMLPAEEASRFQPGMPVQITLPSGQSRTGALDRIEQLPGAEAEIIVALPAPGPATGFGIFFEAAVELRGNEKATVIPREAVIRGAEGPFVYVVNGDAYLRRPVTLGIENNYVAEIRDGLRPGDSVVTKGAMDLWLIELRAVKGGQGCCPAPPVKGKT